MKYLFHGDDQASSRQEMRVLIEKEKKSGHEIRNIDGSKVTTQDLDSLLGTANLFASETVVIENLCSRPVSGERKKLFEVIKKYSGPKNLILWEKKEITKAVVSSLATSPADLKTYLAKTPAVIFGFLDSLVPGNSAASLKLLQECAVSVDEGFIFVMLARHIADLLVASSGDTSRLMPWKKGRLVSQAKSFSEADLIRFHGSLLDIDRKIKTGRTKLSYLDHLDLLLVSLLN